MNRIIPATLAAGLAFSSLGALAPADAASEKFFIKGNPTTCSAMFSELNKQHGLVFGDNVNAEIVVDSLQTGDYTDTVIADGLQQVVSIPRVVGGALFDWKEITASVTADPTDVNPGLDAACIKAGNGRTCYVYQPDSTGDINLSDLNTTQSINTVWFCADDNVTIAEGGPLCDLDSQQVNSVCEVIGSTALFEVYNEEQSLNASQLCACGAYSPSAGGEATQCDATGPGDGIDDEWPSCFVSQNGTPLAQETMPTSSSSNRASGSFCTLYTSNSTSDGSTSYRFCF